MRVVAGDYPPAMILSYCEALPPGSMLHAVSADTDHWKAFLGWDHESYAIGHLYDAINNNTAATIAVAGGKGSKKYKPKPYPTPDAAVAEQREKKNKSTVAGLYAHLTQSLGG